MAPKPLPQIIVSDQKKAAEKFDFNAMVMHAWYAEPVIDKDGDLAGIENVTVNRNLINWLRKYDHSEVVKKLENPRYSLKEFLDDVSDPDALNRGAPFKKDEEEHFPGSIIQGQLLDIVNNKLREFLFDKDKPERLTFPNDSFPFEQSMAITIVRNGFDPEEPEAIRDGNFPIVGLRLIRDAGYRLRKGTITHRFDIVAVCVFGVADENEPKDRNYFRLPGGVVLKGFQGQLQEAWLRVKPAFKGGTNSGVISLLARNMMHNMGCLLYTSPSPRD